MKNLFSDLIQCVYISKLPRIKHVLNLAAVGIRFIEMITKPKLAHPNQLKRAIIWMSADDIITSLFWC